MFLGFGDPTKGTTRIWGHFVILVGCERVILRLQIMLNSSGTCAARRCVWFTIKSVGGVSDPDPTPPNPPEQSSCDMTKIFGGLNGDHTLKLTSHGKK